MALHSFTVRVTDFDAADEYAVDLIPTANGANVRWTGSGLPQPVERPLPEHLCEDPPRQWWLAQQEPTAVDAAGTLSEYDEGACDGLPLFILPRRAFDELVRTGVSTAVSMGGGPPLDLEVAKVGEATLVVAGLRTKVPVLKLAADDATLDVVCSRELPLVVARSESGDGLSLRVTSSSRPRSTPSR
jgi:hypothetical protein